MTHPTPERIADLRERYQNDAQMEGYRRRERAREIDREEDAARELAREIRALQAKVEHARPDDPVDYRSWSMLIDTLGDAAAVADDIVASAKAKSDDVAAGVAE